MIAPIFAAVGICALASLSFLFGMLFARWRFMASIIRAREEHERRARAAGVVFIDDLGHEVPPRHRGHA